MKAFRNFISNLKNHSNRKDQEVLDIFSSKLSWNKAIGKAQHNQHRQISFKQTMN